MVVTTFCKDTSRPAAAPDMTRITAEIGAGAGVAGAGLAAATAGGTMPGLKIMVFSKF